MRVILFGTLLAACLLTLGAPQNSVAQTTLYGGIGRGSQQNAGSPITLVGLTRVGGVGGFEPFRVLTGAEINALE